jgi:hypothetical protein
MIFITQTVFIPCPPPCVDPLEHIFAKSPSFPFYMRKGEMIFYPKTGDDGKDGEHPPLYVQ